MVTELDRVNFLSQEVAVFEIEKRFGSEFVYVNDSGGQSIDRAVLKEFKKLTSGKVVWERGEKMWRRREPHDLSGRQQN